MRRAAPVMVSVILLLAVLLSWHAAFAQGQCAGCRGEASPTLKIKDRLYCHDCFDKIPKICYCCGATAYRVHVVDGSWFCDSCKAKLETCAKCAKKFAIGYTVDGVPICTPCARALSGQCAMCRGSLQGGGWSLYHTLTGEKKSYCKTCEKKYRNCDVCSWLVPEGTPAQWDGRYFCPACYASNVKGTGELIAMYQEVLQVLAEKLGLAIRQKPVLKIIGVGEMRGKRDAMGKADDADTYGLYDSTVMKYTYQQRESFAIKDPKIFILYPLPTQAAYMTLAHESGHAWFAENTRCRTKDMVVIEGFAEWVAWKALQLKGYTAIAQGMAARDDEYGKGLRMFLEKEKTEGFRAMLKWVMTQ